MINIKETLLYGVTCGVFSKAKKKKKLITLFIETEPS
jgi:hypothetical protein